MMLASSGHGIRTLDILPGKDYPLEIRSAVQIDLKVTRSDGERVPIDSQSLRETEIYLASSDLEALLVTRYRCSWTTVRSCT